MASPNTADRLMSFIDASPSPYHAAGEAADYLSGAGFDALDQSVSWRDLTGAHVVRQGGALIAFRIPDPIPASPVFRIVGAHTDSPNLRIKAVPDTGTVGYRQLGVEVYGGVLLNSWLDRDLGLSGRVVVADGPEQRTELVRIDTPLLRVAQLAIHLDREVNDGLKLDRQKHLAPIWGLGDADEGGFARRLAEELDVEPEQIDSWDIMTHDLTPAAVLGVDRSMYAAPRIDNLASCHAAIEALAAADGVEEAVQVVVLFDHEEIGSDSATGAGSPMLANVLERLSLAMGLDRAEHLRAMHRSFCISADGAHAVHPNYVDRHEPEHQVRLNGGPVIKMNANVRYASDAVSVARFAAIARNAGVPTQRYIHRTDLPCGSTIGPITAANLGLSVVDVGSAQLSMHSARELGGVDDPAHLAAALLAFFQDV